MEGLDLYKKAIDDAVYFACKIFDEYTLYYPEKTKEEIFKMTVDNIQKDKELTKMMSRAVIYKLAEYKVISI